MKDELTIGHRIKAWREYLKLGQTDAASRLGIPFGTYQKYELGLRALGAKAVGAFIKDGVNPIWLINGSGDMLASDHSYASGDDAARTIKPSHPPYGFVLVPRYDVAASMGNGSVIHSEQVVDHLAFREEWVRTELGTNPKNLILISAIGDSMEPTLRAGDLLLIDRNNEGVKQDAIYAFSTNGELRVKRMQLKIDGSVVVKSDNPQYEAEILNFEQAHSLRVIGRVVWSGRRM